MQEKIYKSPIKKLVKFFESSRDNWKRKYYEKKIELKRATNRIYDLEKRKDEWKDRAIKAEQRLNEPPKDLPIEKSKKKTKT